MAVITCGPSSATGAEPRRVVHGLATARNRAQSSRDSQHAATSLLVV
ncbi:hypothetical protein ACFQ10_40765 [Streptomyces indonesiensis]